VEKSTRLDRLDRLVDDFSIDSTWQIFDRLHRSTTGSVQVADLRSTPSINNGVYPGGDMLKRTLKTSKVDVEGRWMKREKHSFVINIKVMIQWERSDGWMVRVFTAFSERRQRLYHAWNSLKLKFISETNGVYKRNYLFGGCIFWKRSLRLVVV